MRQILIPLTWFIVVLHAGFDAVASDRPNILWITAEDMSATLGCYGDEYAVTPNIDRLATQSVRYTHTFATAPVCSPSRSCLITGCYATSLGTHNMRSAFPLPDTVRGFPAYLREAGWFTTNNVKTDYNTSSWERLVEESWDESSDSAHWRNRSADESGKPFFSVFNLMTSHQSRSMVWDRDRFVDEVQSRLKQKDIHNPASAPVPPYYPDTDVIRRTIARFYDCVTVMDHQVGQILQQLEEDGLSDETIVFFYSDHGSGLPRHKRALLDTGMHVPLLIRFPQKYRHLAPSAPGTSTDRLVSFVDFAPTVLNLAGVDIPVHMQGLPFLGKDSDRWRDYVYGHRDRVDEAMDLARSVRDQRYLYIRNFMPHLSYNQPTAWPDLGEIRHEFYRLTDPKTMTPAQWHFAGPTKPVEELYDCESDPLNLNNLAHSDAHSQILDRFRQAHRDHVRESGDSGFVPEPILAGRFAHSTPESIAAGVNLADRPPQHVSLARFEAASTIGTTPEEDHLGNLAAASPVERYWGATGLAAQSELSNHAVKDLTKALRDPSLAVRIAAADALGRHGHSEKAVPVLITLLEDEDLTVVLYAARTIELLGESAQSAIPAMRELVKRSEQLRPSNTPATFVQSGDQDLAMFASFSANAFLSKLERSDLQ